jgi:transcription initiation factor IIF auxiliary subunit
MFVALANDPNKDKVGKFVDSVTYHLHPTFKPSVIKVTEAPFLISRIGWGYFEIHMEIVFKKWTGIPKMELDHMLAF